MKSTTKIVAPLIITEIINDLNAPPFFSIAMDSSHYNAENKYFPFASVLLLVKVNTNTNFGGCLHKVADMFTPSWNKAWMILWKMLAVLLIIPAVRIAFDILSIQVEVIVMKLFPYFEFMLFGLRDKRIYVTVFFTSLAFRNPLVLFNRHSWESSVYIKHWNHISILKERSQYSCWLFFLVVFLNNPLSEANLLISCS